MRLIDADAIYSEMKDYYFIHRNEHDASWEGGFGKCMNMIPKAPTSDLQPQKGKWIKVSMACYGGGTITEYKCSKCGEHHISDFDFCPTCGADMRGEK